MSCAENPVVQERSPRSGAEAPSTYYLCAHVPDQTNFSFKFKHMWNQSRRMFLLYSRSVEALVCEVSPGACRHVGTQISRDAPSAARVHRLRGLRGEPRQAERNGRGEKEAQKTAPELNSAWVNSYPPGTISLDALAVPPVILRQFCRRPMPASQHRPAAAGSRAPSRTAVPWRASRPISRIARFSLPPHI